MDWYNALILSLPRVMDDHVAHVVMEVEALVVKLSGYAPDVTLSILDKIIPSSFLGLFFVFKNTVSQENLLAGLKRVLDAYPVLCGTNVNLAANKFHRRVERVGSFGHKLWGAGCDVSYGRISE